MPRPPRRTLRRRSLLHALVLLPLCGGGAWPGTASAQGVELATLSLQREADALTLEFNVRLSLSRAIEDALQRGVPVYFVAEATLWRQRWYWRDERIARVRRTWRLAFQPLTATWRVGMGALSQSHASLPEALAALSSTSRWPLAGLDRIDPDDRYYVAFSYRLDATKLPSPMQIGIGGQPDWVLRVERELPLAHGAAP